MKAIAADLQQGGMSKCLYNSDGEKHDQIFDAACSSKIERNRWTGRCDLRRELRCGIAAPCKCRASDLGGSELGENTGPCVREQPKTKGRRMCCAGENHIDQTWHHSENQSCTCADRDNGICICFCGSKQHVVGWYDRWCVQPGCCLVLIIRTVVTVLLLIVPSWRFLCLRTTHHGHTFHEWLTQQVLSLHPLSPSTRWRSDN